MNVTELMDIGPVPSNNDVSQNNSMNLDLLGGSSANQQNDINTIMSQMLSMNLGLGQPSSVISNGAPSQPIYQQPAYQTMQLPLYNQNPQLPSYQSGIYQPQMNQQGLGQEFLMGPVQPEPVAQQPIYQNISLNLNESPKKEEKPEVDPIKNLTDLSGDFKFWASDFSRKLKATFWKLIFVKYFWVIIMSLRPKIL